jgi:ATP-dependent Clp protease protease subunit
MWICHSQEFDPNTVFINEDYYLGQNINSEISNRLIILMVYLITKNRFKDLYLLINFSNS